MDESRRDAAGARGETIDSAPRSRSRDCDDVSMVKMLKRIGGSKERKSDCVKEPCLHRSVIEDAGDREIAAEIIDGTDEIDHLSSEAACANDDEDA
jgi:hypothetical protein